MTDVATDDEPMLAVRDDVLDAALGLDAELMQRLLREYVKEYGTDAVVADVLVPVLRTVGDLWEAGRLSVMHEHFASQVVRSVVAEIDPAGPRDGRPMVVLACPPAELHELPSHLFAAMLRHRGLATVVLGANTPWKGTVAALRAVRGRACVISGIRPGSLATRGSALARVSASTPVFAAGPAADGLSVPGVVCLPDDWRSAADVVAQTVSGALAPAGLTSAAASG